MFIILGLFFVLIAAIIDFRLGDPFKCSWKAGLIAAVGCLMVAFGFLGS